MAYATWKNEKRSSKIPERPLKSFIWHVKLNILTYTPVSPSDHLILQLVLLIKLFFYFYVIFGGSTVANLYNYTFSLKITGKFLHLG